MVNDSEKWQLLAKLIQKQNKDLKIKSFREFLDSSHLTEKYLDARMSNHGINRTQRMIIFLILAKCACMTPTEISKITLRPIDTINKSVDSLDKMGLTSSTPSKKDRRIREVTLTGKGLEFAENALSDRYTSFSQAMSCFNKEETRLFSGYIKRLTKQVNDLMEERPDWF